MKKSLVLGMALLFAASAHAQTASTTPGGIKNTPIWISEAAPIAGDTIVLSTVVYDNGTTAISGKVSFAIDGAGVGSSQFSLSPGTSKIVSASWTATEGTHSASALVENATDMSANAPVTLADQTAAPLSIVVAAAPPKSETVVAAGVAANVAQSTVNVVLSATDALRQTGVTYFASQLAQDAAPEPAELATATAPQVLGTSTYHAAPVASTTSSNAGSSASTDQLFFTIFNNPWLFYPLFVLCIFVVLWIVSHI